jgi:hypothetical protein
MCLLLNITQLLRAGLSESTRKSYRRSWELFYSFKGTKIITLPLSNIVICNFISYLFEKSFSPGTITSHVLVLPFMCLLLNITFHVMEASTSLLISIIKVLFLHDFLLMMSTYRQGRMAEHKPVRLSVKSAYGQGGMGEPKSLSHSSFYICRNQC